MKFDFFIRNFLEICMDKENLENPGAKESAQTKKLLPCKG